MNNFFIDNPFPMFVFDPKLLRFFEANNAAVRHYGFSRQEFAGMPITRIRVGTEEELKWQLSHLPSGAGQFYSTTHRRRDGSLIDVEVAIGEVTWNGSDARFSIVRDVTEQRKTQASLSRALRFARIGIWELNIATGEVSWTDEVYRIFGYDSGATSITFNGFLNHIILEDRKRFDAAFQAALVSGEPYEIEHGIRRLDGTQRIVHESAVLEQDEDRKPIRAMGTVMDVTDRKLLEQDLRLRSDALALAQKIAKLGSWEIDIVTGRLEWSQELYEIYGMKPGVDVPAVDELWKHDHPADAHQVCRTVSRARHARTRYNLDHRVVRRDGETRWVQEQGEYGYDAAGEPTRFVGTMLDITDRKRAEERIEYLAGHDQLTGLPNYSLPLDRLHQSIAQAQRSNGEIAVALLDVDRFKHVNDALGHAAGDEVLKEIAQRLNDCVRKGDTVSRVGGDEFIIILSNLQKVTDLGSRAQSLLDTFDRPFKTGDREFVFTVSMGISVYPSDSGDAAQLIRNADMAMYQGKGKARSNFQLFNAQMHERTARRLLLEHDLRRAIACEELDLMYQPIVDANSKAVIAVEALVRWNPKGKAAIGPAEFIPIAEDTGLIVGIGEWIVKRACRQWRAWCDSALQPIRMAVNISGKQLERPDFIDMLKTALSEAQMPAKYLELEITETVLMTQSALPTVESLRAFGVRLVIDDFGTGYSSLAYLRQMLIDCLKIDRSFVAYAQIGPADVPICAAIIGLARNLGLRVVAEGIENEAQATILRDLGCDYLQGYYFAKPSAADVIGAMMKSSG